MVILKKATMRIFYSFCILLGIFGVVRPQLTWQKITPTNNATLIQGRRDHAMVYDEKKDRLLVFGGQAMINGGITISDDTWEFNMASGLWREIPTAVRPPNRFSMVYGLANNHFYISTGEGLVNSKRVFYNDIWKFNLDTDTWQAIENKGSPPNPLYGASGGTFSSTSKSFFVTHGFSAQRFASSHEFNVDTETWTEVFGDKSSYIYGHPNGRCLHAGTMVSEHDHVLYGGCASGGEAGGACPGIDSWHFDGSKKSWSQLNYCASPRNYGSMALLPMNGDQKRVVLYGGGENNDAVLTVDIAEADQVAIFNVNEQSWHLKRAKGVPPKKRAAAAMVQHPEVRILLYVSFLLLKQLQTRLTCLIPFINNLYYFFH